MIPDIIVEKSVMQPIPKPGFNPPANAAASTLKPETFLILGTTPDGRPFRPSDWAERLCGTLATYHNHRWVYSSYAQPLMHQGRIGIRIHHDLETFNPTAYRFIMDFARNNQLAIVPEGKITCPETPAKTTEETLSVQKLTLAFLLHQWKIRSQLKYLGF